MTAQFCRVLFASFLVTLFSGVAWGLEEIKAPNVNVKVAVDPHPRTLEDLHITFSIINFGTDSIPYECSLETHGLDFHLFDASGKEIATEKLWFAFNSPRNPNKVSGRFCKLNPGESLTYTLSLNQAFATRWKAASEIKIEWLPTSHPGAPALLSAAYSMEELFGASDDVAGKNNTVSQTKSAARANDGETRLSLVKSGIAGGAMSGTQNETQQKYSSLPLSITIMLIASVFVLALLVLKRRK